MAAGVALAGRVAAAPTVAAGTTTVTTPGATSVMTTPTGTTTITTPGSTYTYATPDPPDAPELLRVFPGEKGSLVLNWSIPPSNGSQIEGYKIYRGTSGGGEALLETMPSNSSDGSVYYVDATVVAGT